MAPNLYHTAEGLRWQIFYHCSSLSINYCTSENSKFLNLFALLVMFPSFKDHLMDPYQNG